MGKQWKQWQTLFSWAPKSLQTVTVAMKLKTLAPWKESSDKPRQHIKKQRHYFANKGQYSQSHGFSSCRPTTSFSVVPFSSWLQSFPALGSFLMSQLFTPGGQSIGVSASASILPMNIQDWFPLEWTGWISWQSKGLPRVFSNTTVQKHQFFGSQLSF